MPSVAVVGDGGFVGVPVEVPAALVGAVIGGIGTGASRRLHEALFDTAAASDFE